MKKYLVFIIGIIYISFGFCSEVSYLNKKRPKPDLSKIIEVSKKQDISFKLMNKEDFFAHFRSLIEGKNLKKIFSLITNQDIDFETKNNMLEMLDYDFYTTFDKSDYNVLFALCKKGFFELVNLILDKHPTLINIIDKKQESLLFPAVLSENLNMIDLILKLKPSLIKINNKYKRNILHIIAINNKYKSLNILLNKFENFFHDFNIIDDLENTPFEYAFFYSNLDIIEILCNKDEDLLTSNIKNQLNNKKDYEEGLLSKFVMKRIKTPMDLKNNNEHYEKAETSPFYRALQMKNIRLIKFFITKRPELINYQDELGKSVLNHAIDLNSLDLVKFLVHKNPDLIENIGYNQLIPLHYAALMGNVEIVEYLLEENPSLINYLSREINYNVLHWAVLSKSIRLVKTLLDKDISLLYKQNIEGEAAIHLACCKGYTNIITILLEKDINILNIKTLDHYDPFLCAVHDKQLTTIRQLIPHFDTNSTNDFEIIGRALFLACSLGYLKIFKILLLAFPDMLYIQNIDGINLFQNAINTDHLDISTYLLQVNPGLLPAEMDIKAKNTWNLL